MARGRRTSTLRRALAVIAAMIVVVGFAFAVGHATAPPPGNVPTGVTPLAASAGAPAIADLGRVGPIAPLGGVTALAPGPSGGG